MTTKKDNWETEHKERLHNLLYENGVDHRDKAVYRTSDRIVDSIISALKSQLIERLEGERGKCPCKCGCYFKDGCLCRGDAEGWNEAISKAIEIIKEDK